MSTNARDNDYLPSNNNNSVQVTNLQGKYSIDEAVEFIGFGKAQLWLSLIAGVIWMADAMELTILSIVSPEVRCMWNLSSYEEAFITTVVFLGMGVSSSWWGNVCDRHGRKVGLLLCAAWTTYFGFLSALSPNYTWLVILRFLTGFGIGGAPQSVTLYSEFLPVKTRSRCIMAIEVFWAIGTVFEVFLALLIMPTWGFRWLLAVSAIPLILVLLAFHYLPESARFNQARGRTDLAQSTLEYIAKVNGKRLPSAGLKESKVAASTQQRIQKRTSSNNPGTSGDDSSVEVSYATTANTMNHHSQEKEHNEDNAGKVSELFKDPIMKKTTLLLWMIWFQCAFAYYGLVLLSTSLFKEAAGGELPPTGVNNTCSENFKEECSLSCKTLDNKDYADLLWVTLSEFPGLLITLIFLELFGRKTTMFFTFAGFGVSSLCLLATNGNRASLNLFLFLARALISGGFQASYVYTPEVFPTKVRALAMGSCSGMARLGALVTPYVAQVLVENHKDFAIFLYSALALLAAFAALMLPIETKGRSLKDEANEAEDPVSRTQISG